MSDESQRVLNGSDAPADGSLRDKVLIVEATTPAQLLHFAVDREASQIVQIENLSRESETSASIVMLENPDAFFAFPFSVILSPNEISAEKEAEWKRLELRFNNSLSKKDVLAEVEALVAQIPRTKPVADNIRLVADELFTNALYNAPVGAAANSGAGGVDRRKDVVYEAGHSARFAIGATADCLVLVCEDSFGTIDVPKVLARVKKCYDVGPEEMINWQEERGGAGLGTYMIFENCFSVYYGVRKGKKTLVACAFALGRRGRHNDLKNIHLIAG